MKRKATASAQSISLSPGNSNFVFRFQKGVLSQRQKWNLATTVDAYKKIGNRNPKWDEMAMEAMEAFAITRGGHGDEDCYLLQAQIGRCAQKAIAVGCPDPFISQLKLRFLSLSQTNGSKGFSAGSYEGGAMNLAKSGYPAIRKFHAWIQTVERYQKFREHPTNLVLMVDMAGGYLKEAVSDSRMPDEDVFAAFESYFHCCDHAQKDAHAAWSEHESLITQRLGGTCFPALLKGQVYLNWAWAARGTDWASEVSAESWRLMYERLGVARQALAKAWQMNTNDWRGPNLMICITQLDTVEEAEMEKWFELAMRNNTNNLEACFFKLNCLYPRWGGSWKEMIGFGQRCLTNTAWVPAVAKILPKAYDQIVLETEGDRSALYHDPALWKGISAAYEKLIRAYPHDTDYREAYAHWALVTDRREDMKRIQSGTN